MALPNIAARDDNRVTVLMGTDISTVNTTRVPVVVGVDSVTNRLLVSAVITGGGSSGTQYNELDTTSPGNGTLALGRYKSSPPTLTDGQYYGLQLDSAGNLKVSGSLSVGGTTDNTAYTAGSSTGTPSYGFYHSTIDTVTDGRTAAIGMTSKRGMFVNLQTAAGVETGVAATPLQVSLANTGANTNKLLVTPDLPSLASTSTKQSDGSQKTQIVDGSGNVIGSTSNALNVNISSGASSGTQYADGAARGTATGTLMMIDDGTNIQSAIGTSAGVLKVDLSATTANSTAVKVDGSAVTQPVSGTFWQATQPVSLATNTPTLQSGSTTAVTQATGTNLHTVVDSGAVTATLNAETTKVIGTVNQGTSPWVTSNATTSVVGNGAAATAQRVTLANDSTGVIATVGAVTSITNALPAGTNVLGHVITDTGSTTAVTGTVAVSGTVTANAGTNLNTSALALETGGNLASIKTDTDNLNLAQGSTTSGQKGNLGLGAVTTAAPTYTTAQSSPLSLDTSGNLRVAGTFSANPPSSVVSTANSTTANLGVGAVFTGTSEDVSNYAALQISVFSSHASATDGLSLQQSSDGTNWDLPDTYTIAATTGKVFSIQPSAKFFRLVYTNGGTLTTSLRIQSVYHYSAPNPSSQRTADAYTNETDLTQNWSFSSLYNGSTWDRMRGDITNGLDVDVTRLPALVAGSAKIGQVAIDQTTPGTTNLVALAANQSVNTAQVNGVTPLMGNGVTGTGSQRVTIASDNTAFTVNAAQSGTWTNTVTQATGTNLHTVLDSGTLTTLTTLTGTTSLTPGVAAANLGKAEDAAHASGDTGVFALAVRNDNLATTYGADQDYAPIAVDANSRVMVAQKASTATLSNVAASATSVTALAANASRIGATITNDSSAVVYLKFGTTASTTSYTVVLAGAASAPFSYYEIPAGYTGRIDAISASATGNYRVTEIT